MISWDGNCVFYGESDFFVQADMDTINTIKTRMAYMCTNLMLIDKMQADKLLALQLERALMGVKEHILEQGQRIQQGATRLMFYTSCFTDNYQDVCANQKQEDIRFAMAIINLTRHWNVIRKMIRIYVDLLLRNISSERIRRIQASLIKKGAIIASNSSTNHALSASITTAVCSSISLSQSVRNKLLKYSAATITIAGYYGYVQDAANAANMLKQQHVFYYNALYAEKLEMLYFLIEPVVGRHPRMSRMILSDDEMVNEIMRIIR